MPPIRPEKIPAPEKPVRIEYGKPEFGGTGQREWTEEELALLFTEPWLLDRTRGAIDKRKNLIMKPQMPVKKKKPGIVVSLKVDTSKIDY